MQQMSGSFQSSGSKPNILQLMSGATVFGINGDTTATTLPAGIFDTLTALTQLDLDQNVITTLPAGIFDTLTALTQLDLDQNVITTLPAGIFDTLTTLQFLLLGQNELTTLAGISLAGITTLNVVFFNNNNLDVTSVNQILQDLVTGSLANAGIVDVSGGTNAVPTGAGAAAVITLQGAGWTVNTN